MTLRLLLLASLFALTSGTSLAVTVDELVARHIEARGGSEKLHAIRSLRLTGKVDVSGDFEAEFALSRVIRRPGQVRTDLTLQGLTSVRAWDGHEGWAISPLFGRKDAQRLSRDESKEMIDLADIDGPLVDSAGKGNRIEYLGTEDVEGTPAHKLRVTTRDGDVQYVYLDPDYYLVIRILYQRSVRGARVESETDFADYEKVDGVYFPFSIDSGPRGGEKTRKITIDKAEANVPLSDAWFEFPAARK
jgi:outer membrane lipoprotein-sorting protein